MKTYAQTLADYEQQLTALGEEAEALSFAFRQVRNLSLTDLVLRLREPVDPEDHQLLDRIFRQLAQHRPAQYIIGHTDFAGLRLKVDERVLIPRPETEELVSLVLAENADDQYQVLDLCTGSGALALALKSARPGWQVSASDISPEALALAEENANVQDLPINFYLSDLFNAISGKFDMIVSNPPYIALADQDEVAANVLAWEPHLALFAEENGLAVYRQIAESAGRYLTPEGKLYLEIGYKQGPAVGQLFRTAFPDRRVRVLADSFGRDRMVVVDCG